MKKLLLGTIVLLSFCLAGIIFQISCTKNSGAQPNPTNTGLKQLNKILYMPNDPNDKGSGIWIANYDGSNPQELNITLPQGLKVGGGAAGDMLSPDGKTIFFYVLGGTQIKPIISLYSGSLDGNTVNNITKVIDGTSAGMAGVYLEGVY